MSASAHVIARGSLSGTGPAWSRQATGSRPSKTTRTTWRTIGRSAGSTNSAHCPTLSINVPVNRSANRSPPVLLAPICPSAPLISSTVPRSSSPAP